MLPLARDVELRIVPSAGYSVGRIYGADRAVVRRRCRRLAHASFVFLGARTGPTERGHGRRGGGGGFFVELMGDAEQASPMDRIRAHFAWNFRTSRPIG